MSIYSTLLRNIDESDAFENAIAILSRHHEAFLRVLLACRYDFKFQIPPYYTLLVRSLSVLEVCSTLLNKRSAC